ncbi:TPA: hypothetical protein N8237_000593 [Escherichia coli]|jgi:hypothetical protein|uniref:hypothetical protein n=1 Tax=Escherichia TaxID=561 RepID=UPI000B441F9E|nr:MULTISPECIES: hypothetical protein [Escherichia]EFN0062990.1 hypothetical protein [Escherichia coli]EFO1079978.1 hypothetical protein [Escherichia coli]EHP6126763.1 hypothetical protein [Escherichia coli]EIC1335675.1 hypothetical protein [Escherichia coli]EIC1591905.1 hypothetical protein [Escherichia coli]
MNDLIKMLQQRADDKYRDKRGHIHSNMAGVLGVASDEIKAVFKRQKTPKWEVFVQVVNELNCGRGVIGFLYDGEVSEAVEEMDARIAELKGIIADKDAQIRELEARLMVIGTKAAQDVGKAKKAVVAGTNREFKKPVRFKADTVLDYLKANAPLHGVNHAGLIKAIWPIGAPGRNTFLALLKQLKEDGLITITQHGRAGMDIHVNG